VADAGLGGKFITTGAHQSYGADGTYVLDYSNAVETAQVGGQTYEYRFHGKVTGHYTLNGSGADYSDMAPTGTYQLTINGTAGAETPLTYPGSQHDDLTCSGNHLTQHTTALDSSSGVTIEATAVVELTRE
jgi:hypothetical protein